MRHAHIETHKKMLGRHDVPLSEQGINQVCLLKRILTPQLIKSANNISFSFNSQTASNLIPYFQSIYVSPLLRARQTANLFLKDTLTLQHSLYTVEPRFQEIHLGQWEGLQKQEIIQKYPEIWYKRGEDVANTAPPEGESFACLQKRVLPCFYEILTNMKENLPVLIIAHQAVNRVILANLQNIDLQNLLNIPQDYSCASRIEISEKNKNIHNITIETFNINTL